MSEAAHRQAHTLRLASTPDDVAAAAAAEIVAVLGTAVAWRGEAHLCLAGGSTPRLLHQALAASAFDAWPQVHIWFGDERCVPPAHADSNAGMVKETLIDHVPVDPAHVHRLRGELPPEDGARAYDEALRDLAERQGRRVPVMDVLVLGMGADGHTASVFPGSPLLSSESPRDTWCAAVHVPALTERDPAAIPWRLTLTPPVLQAAAAIVVLVTGSGKQATLARVLRRAAPVEELPIRLLEDARGDLAWFVDDAALFG